MAAPCPWGPPNGGAPAVGHCGDPQPTRMTAGTAGPAAPQVGRRHPGPAVSQRAGPAPRAGAAAREDGTATPSAAGQAQPLPLAAAAAPPPGGGERRCLDPSRRRRCRRLGRFLHRFLRRAAPPCLALPCAGGATCRCGGAALGRAARPAPQVGSGELPVRPPARPAGAGASPPPPVPPRLRPRPGAFPESGRESWIFLGGLCLCGPGALRGEGRRGRLGLCRGEEGVREGVPTSGLGGVPPGFPLFLPVYVLHFHGNPPVGDGRCLKSVSVPGREVLSLCGSVSVKPGFPGPPWARLWRPSLMWALFHRSPTRGPQALRPGSFLYDATGRDMTTVSPRSSPCVLAKVWPAPPAWLS